MLRLNNLIYNINIELSRKITKTMNAGRGLCNRIIDSALKYLAIYIETSFLHICGLQADKQDLRLLDKMKFQKLTRGE